MNKLSIYSSTILLSATSCGETFYPDFDTDPVAVLNSMIIPGENISAEVTNSFVSSAGLMNKDLRIIKDATVSLFVNDDYRGLMQYDSESKKYVSDIKAATCDKVKIKVSTPKYGDAEGETIIPDNIEDAAWSFTTTVVKDPDAIIVRPDDTLDYQISIICDYSLTFVDPVDAENYYFLISKQTAVDCSDPILGENDSPIDAVFPKDTSFIVFSDKSIAGKEYTLNFSCKRNYTDLWIYPNGVINDFCLYSISKDYYLYLISIYKKYNGFNGELENLGIAEPKFIYSNVSPGVGIVAAQTPVCTILHDVTDIIKEE